MKIWRSRFYDNIEKLTLLYRVKFSIDKQIFLIHIFHIWIANSVHITVFENEMITFVWKYFSNGNMNGENFPNETRSSQKRLYFVREKFTDRFIRISKNQQIFNLETLSILLNLFIYLFTHTIVFLINKLIFFTYNKLNF